MIRIFGILIAVIFFAVGHTASAQDSELLKKAQDGEAEAQFDLSFAYLVGDSVDQNHGESVKWLQKAADQGLLVAQYNLGSAYYHGDGVEQDYAEAVKWWRLAAEQGDADAQYNLGIAYRTGNGTIKGFAYAHMWFNIAASLGSTTATEARDSVAKEMTPEQIAEAQKLARECVRKAYKDC